jgi:hypothetical protein
MRHKKHTIHKYKNRNKSKNKYNNTRKNSHRNRSKQTRLKYKSKQRKTIKLRGGSDVIAKAYGAVQKGLSSVGSVFGGPNTTKDIPRLHEGIIENMTQMVEIPLPNKQFTNVEYTRMIEFQKNLVDLINGIKNSKIKSPYAPFSILLQNIVDFNKQMGSHKHYNFLIGYYPSTSENNGLKIIDFSTGDNQLPMVMKLYIKSAQFVEDYSIAALNNDAKGIEQDIFEPNDYIGGIANDTIYNYKPTLIGMLDAIYYCIPDKTICLELTRRLHGVDPHIVEHVSPLTWTTPLCTAVSFLKDKNVIVELMELIKSNQLMQKALFRYYRDSYYPEIHDDKFRENGIKLIGDRVDSVKIYILIKNMLGMASKPDGTANMNAIIIRNSTRYMYDMLANVWEKYKGYIMKYCIEWYEPGLPLAISQWLGESILGYITEIKKQEQLQNMSEAELLAQFEEDTQKADNKGPKNKQPIQKQQQQPKKNSNKEVEDRKKAEAEEKERIRFEQARLRAEAEERKRVVAKAEAERKRIADEAEAERKRVADEEKKAAKAAKKAQKKTEEALAAASSIAKAEEARAREKQRLIARTPPVFESEPEKYSKMEESSQEPWEASQSIEMEDTTPFQSITEPVALAKPISSAPKVAYVYPDLSGLRMLGVNPDAIIASTMSLLQTYIDSGNIDGVCGLITSKITNYTLQSNRYYNFMSCVTFIIIGQLTELLKTTKYRLILKGSKALQVTFSNPINTKPFLISDDIDILLVAADRGSVQRNPRMYEDSGMVAGDICSMIEWIIKTTLPSALVSILNPMKQYSRNPNVFKISHLEPNGKLSVIADIDIRYTKNTYMALPLEDRFLAERNFPIMTEDQSFDVFYNPSRMVDTTIDMPMNIKLVYSHQTIDVAFEEKVYYYIKYILLKTSDNDNIFLLDKFKKSIIAILNYNYLRTPTKERGKFIEYSKWYIKNVISPIYSNKQFSALVFRSLFA